MTPKLVMTVEPKLTEENGRFYAEALIKRASGATPEEALSNLTAYLLKSKDIHELRSTGQDDRGFPKFWFEIAASAYRAYAANTGNKNFRGEPMPTWEQLPQPIQDAWEAAARQVLSIVQCEDWPFDTRRATDETRWTGWTPNR